MSRNQDFTTKQVRAAASLTDTFVIGTILDVRLLNQMIMNISLTLAGAQTFAEVRVEFSHDQITWHQRTLIQVDFAGDKIDATVGPYRIDATSNLHIAVPLLDRFVRISARADATEAGSSMAIEALLGIS